MDKNKYRNGWRDKNYKRFEIVVPVNNKEVKEKLESVENRSGYIIGLVEADLKKES